jgi:hypothetical protein
MIPSSRPLQIAATPIAALLLSIAVILSITTALPARAQTQAPTQDTPITFAAFGDTPYSGAEERGLERLIPVLNAAPVDFVVHVGDIKSGSSSCSDEYLMAHRRLFEGIRRPFVLLPGDNEWTDCHRPAQGRFDPVERLAFLRRHVLFGWPALPAAFGLEAQAPDDRDPLALPENRLWHDGPVTFVALNVPGSNNNMARAGDPDTEREQRMTAVTRWLRTGLERARSHPSKALVVFFHANPMFDRAHEGPIARRDGFRGFKDELVRLARDFGKPVLLIHGDTHSYQFNQPLRDADGRVVPNVWRLEVPGSPFVNWVRVTIDPTQSPPFTTVQGSPLSLEAAP